MSPRPLFAVLCSLLFAAPVHAADPLGEGLVAYRDAARSVAADLEAGVEPQSLAPALAALSERAAALVEPFSARRPACADYLRAASALRDRWSTMTLDEIEQGYHRDDALPAIADPNARAVCYQMKDLIVHPLSALRLLQEDAVDTSALRHEVVEVVAHSQALALLTGAVPPSLPAR